MTGAAKTLKQSPYNIHSLKKEAKIIRLFPTYTSVYYWNRDSKKRFVVNQGGTSSSKTYSIMQVLCKKALDSKVTITIVAKTANSLDRGALRDFKTILTTSPYLKYSIKDPTLVTGPYRFKNGSIIEFVNLNDASNARHGKRQYLFLNEANTIDFEAVQQLMVRTAKQIFIDFNPDSKFWVHEDIINRPNADYFISNFKHNPYCAPQTILDILDYRRKWLESIIRDKNGKILEQNVYWRNKWYVYGLGLTGIVEGVIYQDVEYVLRLPRSLRKRAYALDFGFANDPLALCVAGIRNSKIYAKELIYETGLTTPDVIKRFKNLGITKDDLIIADNANPEAIEQIRRAGYNIIPCKKGPGSVKTGVNALQERQIVLTHACKNWKREQENYKYAQKNGVFTAEPEDKHNHLWDALRYWYQHWFRPTKLKTKPRHKRVIRRIAR